jgi:methionyl-tRNA synthetase
MWSVIRAANAYVDHQAPWALKDDVERRGPILYVLAEAIRHLGILGQPYMPESCGRMLDQLAVAADARDFSCLGPDHALSAGTALPKPEGIFPRLVEDAATS